MAFVPAGEFIMGTNKVDTEDLALEHGHPRPWYEDEHPLRRIKLPAFYIDFYEVTNEDYKVFVESVQRRPPDNWVKSHFPEGKDRFPVTHVNWFDADDYCRWAGKRLPTEEEWEKSARGPDGLEYPWSDAFDPSLAHIANASVMMAVPVAVGTFEEGKSVYGVHDLIGNVWEWTRTWYRPYPGNEAENEKFGQIYRVTRGLSFMSVGHYPSDTYSEVASIIARASFRSYDYPTSRLMDVGFRCAKSVD